VDPQAYLKRWKRSRNQEGKMLMRPTDRIAPQLLNFFIFSLFLGLHPALFVSSERKSFFLKKFSAEFSQCG
jgi:hypothetical protein